MIFLSVNFNECCAAINTHFICRQAHNLFSLPSFIYTAIDIFAKGAGNIFPLTIPKLAESSISLFEKGGNLKTLGTMSCRIFLVNKTGRFPLVNPCNVFHWPNSFCTQNKGILDVT